MITRTVPADPCCRTGTGEAITVDASKIDLSFVDVSKLTIGGDPSTVDMFKGKLYQALVYGSISVQYLGNNTVKILDDKYDFDMHRFSNWRETFRNVETIFASGLHGYGKPFDIHFKGVNKIN